MRKSGLKKVKGLTVVLKNKTGGSPEPQLGQNPLGFTREQSPKSQVRGTAGSALGKQPSMKWSPWHKMLC